MYSLMKDEIDLGRVPLWLLLLSHNMFSQDICLNQISTSLGPKLSQAPDIM